MRLQPGQLLMWTGGGAGIVPGETQAALLKTGTGAFTIDPNAVLANEVTFALTNTTINIPSNGTIRQDMAGRSVTKIGAGTVIYSGTASHLYRPHHRECRHTHPQQDKQRCDRVGQYCFCHLRHL